MSERTIYLKLEPLANSATVRKDSHSKILQFAFDLGVYAERTPFHVIRVEQVDWWVTAVTIHATDSIAYTAMKLKYGEMFMKEFTGPESRGY